MGANAMTMEARMDFRNPLGATSVAVIVLTFILFTIALFAKGFTKDLLLEAGVFLVSVKLILMSYKNTVTVEAIDKKTRPNPGRRTGFEAYSGWLKGCLTLFRCSSLGLGASVPRLTDDSHAVANQSCCRHETG